MTFPDVPWFDPVSIALVIGGTLVATLLRCGPHGCRVALRTVRALAGPRFDADRARASLACQLQEIREDGFPRADAHHCGDGEFDALADLLIARRSVDALYHEHEALAAERERRATAGAEVFAHGAEIAPVMGLAGTLLALADGARAASGTLSETIGMAVATTLWGLILANLVLAPIAAAIARRAEAEEADRRAVLDWLADGVRRAREVPVMPVRTPADAEIAA